MLTALEENFKNIVSYISRLVVFFFFVVVVVCSFSSSSFFFFFPLVFHLVSQISHFHPLNVKLSSVKRLSIWKWEKFCTCPPNVNSLKSGEKECHVRDTRCSLLGRCGYSMLYNYSYVYIRSVSWKLVFFSAVSYSLYQIDDVFHTRR